jgi:hypothetical protein|tara:strand:+ start:187 stop:462 length:276 start_codon:yes stop_codon:yes gene_type:complete
MILEIIIGILGVLVVILGYTTFNLLKKIEKAEDIIISQNIFIKNISDEITKTQEKLGEIDKKGTFEGDDEIGWFFNTIKQLQNNLSRFKLN